MRLGVVGIIAVAFLALEMVGMYRIAQSIGAQISPQGFLLGGHLVFIAALLLRIALGGRILSRIASLRSGK